MISLLRTPPPPQSFKEETKPIAATFLVLSYVFQIVSISTAFLMLNNVLSILPPFAAGFITIILVLSIEVAKRSSLKSFFRLVYFKKVFLNWSYFYLTASAFFLLCVSLACSIGTSVKGSSLLVSSVQADSSSYKALYEAKQQHQHLLNSITQIKENPEYKGSWKGKTFILPEFREQLTELTAMIPSTAAKVTQAEMLKAESQTKLKGEARVRLQIILAAVFVSECLFLLSLVVVYVYHFGSEQQPPTSANTKKTEQEALEEASSKISEPRVKHINARSGEVVYYNLREVNNLLNVYQKRLEKNPTKSNEAGVKYWTKKAQELC